MKHSFSFSRILIFVSIVFGVLIFTFSCKKDSEKSDKVFVEPPTDENLKSQFFKANPNTPFFISKVMQKMEIEDKSNPFIRKFTANLGLPLWNKAISNYRSNSGETENSNTDTIHTIIPIVQNGSNEVNAVLACRLINDSVTITLINEANYAAYGFDNNSALNADRVVGLMMFMQNHLFNTTSFVIKDARLFSSSDSASSQKRLIRFKHVNNTSSENVSEQDYTYIDVCYEICCNCGQLNQGGIYCSETCTTYAIYTGGGSGGGTGGGGSGNSSGGNYNFSGGNTGGGGSGSGGGTGFDDQNNPVIPTQELLRYLLNLSQDEVDFLGDNLVFTEEAWYYMNNPDGTLTEEQKKKLIRTHIQFGIQSLAYKNFSWDQYITRFNQHGWAAPWFHHIYLSVSNPALRANIVNLNLDAVQAYYLWNNPVRSVEINNNGQFSSLTTDIRYPRIKFHIDKLMSNSNYGLFISNYAAANNGNIMWWENPIFNTGNNVDWNFWIDVNAKIPSNTNGSENYEYIQNIEDYLKCFNDGKTASSYELKIYIDDPAGDGAFQPDYIKKGIKDAGHTFVEVIKNNTDGTKVSQLIGFYPDPNNLPNLQNTSTISKLKNDSKHEFDSKIEMYITGANFNTVLDQIRNYSTGVYDFETFNCTSFAQQVSSSIGITLPSGYRTFGERGGRTYSGVCPTGLQQDIFNWPNKPANVHNVQKYNVSQNASIGNGKCP